MSVLPCPTFDPMDDWIGIPHDNPLAGCDVGCLPCLDETSGSDQWVNTGVLGGPGSRWLRPNKEMPHRDARGHVRPLRSWRVHEWPAEVNMEISPCYDNFGLECFGERLCACHPMPSASVDPPPGIAPCIEPDLFASLFHDRWWFKGSNWGTADLSWFHCRVMEDIHNEPIKLGRGPLYQAQFVSTDRCAMSALIPCIAKIPHGDCFQDVGHTYYNHDTGQRSIWSRVFVDQIAASLSSASPVQKYVPGSESILEIKNTVLEFVEQDRAAGANGVLHFDQMDHAFFDQPNGMLGSYGREFNSFFQMPLADLPVVLTLEGRLAVNGAPVQLQVFVAWAALQMHLVVHTVKWSTDFPPEGRDRRAWPSVRMRLRVKLGILASYTDGEVPQVDRPWLGDTVTLAIENPTDQEPLRLPRIVNDLDQIVYTLNGEDFTFQQDVDWWGELSALSDPAWQNVMSIAESCSGMNICCALAGNLSPTVVHGKETWRDGEIEPRENYLGHIQWGFRDVGNACGDCFEDS